MTERSVEVPEGVKTWVIWRTPGSILGAGADHIQGPPLGRESVRVIDVSDLLAIRASIHADVRERLIKALANTPELRKLLEVESHTVFRPAAERFLDTALPTSTEEEGQDAD